MPNPLVPLGSLNLLRASASLIELPYLNVTASYLADGLISLTFEGEASGYIGTATGAVPSPNPYQIVTCALHLLRTQNLSEQWKEQQELTTTIGDMVVTGDSTALSSYFLSNCTIMGIAELEFAGKTPVYQVNIRGTYFINAALWAAQ